MEVCKLKSLLQDKYLNSTQEIKPGDPLYPNTLERDRGEVSKILSIEEAILAAAEGQKEGKSKDGGRMRRMDDLFRITHIKTFYYIQHIGRYFAGLFSIETKDKRFKRQIRPVWGKIIKNFYFGSIYVGYGEDLVELDKSMMTEERRDKGRTQLTKFRLYTKVDKNKYRSIFSQEIIESEKLEERLVRFWIDDSNFWLEWWHILSEYFGSLERVKYSALAAHKRALVSIEGGMESFKNEMQCFDDPICVVHRMGMTADIQKNEGSVNVENTYEPFEFMPADAPQTLLEFYKSFLETQIDFLGMMGKGSPHKKERLTQRESNTGINIVSTVQESLRQELESFFDECRVVFGEDVIPDDLEILITNRSSNDATFKPEEQNKVLEKPYFDIDG